LHPHAHQRRWNGPETDASRVPHNPDGAGGQFKTMRMDNGFLSPWESDATASFPNRLLPV
jgi:hypothetical protein